MGAEPAVFGAFYRRFEDEVLGYFLARGATPEVAADLTSETFAASLPSRRWNRLADKARGVLEVSCGVGRVSVEARRRRHMPPLVLTDDAVARIAAIDRNKFAHARVLHASEQDDVRARVIDESDFDQLATNLRLSDCVVRLGATDPHGHRGDRPRIPELERDFVAAAARVPMRPRRHLVALAGLAVAVLAFIVFAPNGGHRPASSSPAKATATSTAQSEQSAEEEIVRTGSAWATSFAASGRESCVDAMTQPACERVTCNSVRGPLKNCVPLPRSVKRSFRGATVQDVVVKGGRAAARFSNGEIVEFAGAGRPGSPWMVHVVGNNAGRIYHEAKIVLAGNAWARFFASSTRHCVEHMTAPACEQVLSARFKRSFRDATVRDVLVIKGRRAAAKFSNGEVVAFLFVADGGGRWSVDRLGRYAGRGLLPE